MKKILLTLLTAAMILPAVASADEKEDFLNQLRSLEGKVFSCEKFIDNVKVKFPYSTITTDLGDIKDGPYHVLYFSLKTSSDGLENLYFQDIRLNPHDLVRIEQDPKNSDKMYWYDGYHDASLIYLSITHAMPGLTRIELARTNDFICSGYFPNK